jgi:predicted CopG family antitoxin
MEKTEITTIQISKETREKLADIGKKGETYDDIIKKLIKKAKECEQK